MHNADTSKSDLHVPWYLWESIDDMKLPKGCELVGVELTDDAVDLPTFRHPAARGLCAGRGGAGPVAGDAGALLAYREDPDAFLHQLSLAGALVMYDRTISMGGFAPRPVAPGGPPGADRKREV